MKIIRFRAENIMRLRVVEITPSGDIVVLGGKNRAGKTSVLDSIMMALGGARTMCDRPIRKGTKQAEVELDLGELVVKRTFTKKGTTLKVTGKDGTALASPQAVLDKLTGLLTFDPLQFTKQAPKTQLETLKSIAGLDFTDLRAKRDVAYTQRTAVNRDVVQAASIRDGLASYPDAPAELVSVDELTAEHKKRQTINGIKATAQRVLDDLRTKQETFSTRASEAHDRATELAEAARRVEEDAKVALKEAERIESHCNEAAEKVAAMPEANEDEIVQQLAAASETNRRVTANTQHAEATARCKTLSKQSDNLTGELERIDEQKAQAIAEAKLPVDGLGLDEEQVLLGGLPFSQASSAEQLHASVAIAAAMNPELKIMLIRDGSLMDSDSLKLLCELSAKHECQVWIERVGEGEECQVIIEDGRVKDTGDDA